MGGDDGISLEGLGRDFVGLGAIDGDPFGSVGTWGWNGLTGGSGSPMDSLTGAGASRDAVKAQTEAAAMANATQRYMYDTTRNDFEPWRDAGLRAVGGLESNDFMKNFKGDPGYQFRMQEGMKALEGSAAARGSLNSGATLKALNRYGQDFASNEYGNAYGREFGRLSSLANLGQASTAQTAAAGQNMANQVSNNQTSMGNANAAATMNQANRQSNMLMQGAGIAAMAYCDERLKKNIRPVSPADLNELRSVIKPCHFNYIADEFGAGEWVGVMAQDLEGSKLGRTVVFEDAHGRKKVDMKKLLSLLVITFAPEGAA